MMGDQELLEILQLIVVEGNEMIDEVEPQLIALQQEEDVAGEVDQETLNAIFRLFHSIKGSASSLDLNNIAIVTHKAETLLDLIRSGKARLTVRLTDLFLRAIDLIRIYLDKVDQEQNDEGHEDARDGIVSELLAEIDAISENSSPAPVSKSKNDEDSIPELEISAEMIEKFAQEAFELLDQTEEHMLLLEGLPDNSDELIAEVFRLMHSFKGNCGLVGIVHPERLSHKAENVLQEIKEGNVEITPDTIASMLKIVDRLRESISDMLYGGGGEIDGIDRYEKLLEGLISGDQPDEKSKDCTDGEDLDQNGIDGSNGPEKKEDGSSVEHKDAEKKHTPKGASKTKSVVSTGRRAIRVDLEKLDVLINLVGELVTAQAMVVKNPDLDGIELENFEKAAHHMSRIVTDLQDVAMSVRMIPLSGIFRKMIRVTHDLARKAGKKIQLDFLGEDTEVDKTVIEHIGDPLVHMVRNSIDHGLETPGEREVAGKDQTGNVTLEARHEGGEVWILITDNGRGLDREKILAKARENGLIQDDGVDLRDEEVFRMIFEPGFSTATKVTDVSGRGVGMDVVRRNIEKIKGRVSVRSVKGEGTTITMHIPLTLAIIDGMLIRVGDSRFTVPTLAIRESFQSEKEDITELPDGQEIVRIRDELLPVLRLHEAFGRKPQSTDLHDGILIVVRSHERAVCLFADEILGQQETVIKGLSEYIGNIRGVSGCTILGDGEISLILDVGSLVDMAEENSWKNEDRSDSGSSSDMRDV